MQMDCKLPGSKQLLQSPVAQPLRPAARRAAVRTMAIAAPPKPSSVEQATPAQLGYTMPGEFEKHTGCWMGWPDSGYLWRDNAEPAQEQYANIAKAISEFEPLTMFANAGAAADKARSYFKDSPNVTVVDDVPIDDGWTRDWGPSCIAKTEGGKRVVAGVHWDYDCYGGTQKKILGEPTMMPNWDRDAEAGRALLRRSDLEIFECPLHLEGGSIHTDGEGTLIVTEQCLLSPTRNPNLDRAGIEHLLKEYLGLKKVIWFWRGICGDDAVVNGHVDNFCCFAEPGKVMLAWTDDEMDPQWEVSNRALDVLKNTTDAKGRKIEVCKIRLPPPQFRNYREAEGLAPDHIEKGYVPRIAGERLPATYINHYTANGGAVVPQFGYAATAADERALEDIYQAYNGERRVVGVKSREVVLNAGNIHCITQQQPASW
jgi:agmatine deiminase